MSLTLDPAVYWRLRYLQAVADGAEARAKWEVAKAQAAYADALRQAGVSPTAVYEWQDATTSLQDPRDD